MSGASSPGLPAPPGMTCPACDEPFATYEVRGAPRKPTIEFALCASCGHIFIADQVRGHARNMTEGEKLAMRACDEAGSIRRLQESVVRGMWG